MPCNKTALSTLPQTDTCALFQRHPTEHLDVIDLHVWSSRTLFPGTRLMNKRNPSLTVSNKLGTEFYQANMIALD
jgi:hypothetical protein